MRALELDSLLGQRPHTRGAEQSLCVCTQAGPGEGVCPGMLCPGPLPVPVVREAPPPAMAVVGGEGAEGRGLGVILGEPRSGHEPSARCPRDGKGSPCRGQRTVCVQPSFLPLLPPEPCPGPGLLLGAFRTECDGGIKRICLETLPSDPEDCSFDVIRKP